MSNDDLICKLECHDVFVKLASALDRGANSEAADFFTDDGTLVMPDGEATGPAVRERLLKRPSHIITRHLLTNVIIKPIDPTTAEGRAYILVYRVTRGADAAAAHRLPNTPAAAGDWIVSFRKTVAGWRISRYEAVPIFTAAE